MTTEVPHENARHRILVVDDDVTFASPVLDYLGTRGIDAELATSCTDARKYLRSETPSLMFVDLMLPDGNGLELVKECRGPKKPRVVLMTGHPSIDSAIGALREHVDEYLIKPLCMEDLVGCLDRLEPAGDDASSTPAAARAGETARGRPERTDDGLGAMKSVSKPMHRLFDAIEKVAATDAAVLVQGESGTGKELVARAVHDLSGRAGRLVALNCGAVPEHLIGSELFGHEKGSFTGATNRRLGSFELAHTGTLFLDEITEMPVDLQVNLLRVLETGRVARVGGNDEVEVDVRIVAATNRDPVRAVEEGKLREDLYFRLNVFPVDVPPLRERPDDVPLLARHFLDELNHESDTDKHFSEAAIDALSSHHWPGNVRELRHAVKRAFILADETIEAEHLPVEPGTPLFGADGEKLAAGMSIGEAERRLIELTLSHFDGDKKKTAKALGVSLKTLYNRLNQYADDDAAHGGA